MLWAIVVQGQEFAVLQVIAVNAAGGASRNDVRKWVENGSPKIGMEDPQDGRSQGWNCTHAKWPEV